MLPLVPHPSTPERAWRIAARAERTAGGELRLRYVLEGALGGVRIPPPGALRRGTDLWRHTCFEAFIAAEGKPGYVELNFSPSREWAAYAFHRYREGGPLTDSRVAPQIVVRRESERLGVDVLVELEDLSVSYRDAALRVGLSAVVESNAGRCSYWALRHPAVKPDFHHEDGFALRLEESHA
ncbi:MAG TPA: DOMON-like domain-containing protein [Candidatus Eisenbacteria bacterium]|nr:DOMON-like domain-containing protein [Candidatus Eisenbacteria bacterium]